MSFTTGNDINILQGTDLLTVGAGAGNDRYVLDASTLNPNQRITLSDTQGTNTLQLAGGLAIVSSLVANDSLQLTLINGAVITVLGASSFRFQTGGNAINGTGGTVQTYADFATLSLGLTGVPVSGAAPAAGGTKTVSDTGGAGNLTGTNIKLNLLNEAQYDAAYLQGARGDALLPLAGVYVSNFRFSLNGQEVNLTTELGKQESATNDSAKTYGQEVAAINAALTTYKARPENISNLALQTVKAELGNKFLADVSTLANVGRREGTSIVLSVDPTTGALDSGFNVLTANVGGFQLDMTDSSIFPNTNRYERVITDAVQSGPLQLVGVIALPDLL